MNNVYTNIRANITFLKPIIERDDGQNFTPCVATHSEETRVA